MWSSGTVLQGSHSFDLFKFNNLFKFSKTLGLAVTLKIFSDFPCVRVFLDPKQFNRHKLWSYEYIYKLWCPPKCVPFALFNQFSLFYIVLALSSAVTKLSNKTLIFHDLQGPTIKFQDFPGLENEMLQFHDFPGFPWPVRTLFKVFPSLCHC